jgi:hypothetical protein
MPDYHDNHLCSKCEARQGVLGDQQVHVPTEEVAMPKNRSSRKFERREAYVRALRTELQLQTELNIALRRQLAGHANAAKPRRPRKGGK